MTTLDWVSELPPLLERLVDGEFTCEDWARLNEFLSQGDQPRRYYHRYMKVHAALEWRNGGRNEAEAAKRWIPSVTAQLPSLPASPQSAVDFQILPSAGMFGSAYHGAVGYFSSGWPVAYLVATVIFGIGVLIGSLRSRVPASTGRQAIVSAQPGGRRAEDGTCRADHRHGQLPVGRSGDGGFQRRAGAAGA